MDQILHNKLGIVARYMPSRLSSIKKRQTASLDFQGVGSDEKVDALW